MPVALAVLEPEKAGDLERERPRHRKAHQKRTRYLALYEKGSSRLAEDRHGAEYDRHPRGVGQRIERHAFGVFARKKTQSDRGCGNPKFQSVARIPAARGTAARAALFAGMAAAAPAALSARTAALFSRMATAFPAAARSGSFGFRVATAPAPFFAAVFIVRTAAPAFAIFVFHGFVTSKF